MEWAYVAGYFDGEGHVAIDIKRDHSRANGLVWSNCHESSLVAMRDFMGVGIVRRDKDRKGVRRIPIYRLSVTRRADLLAVIESLLPHLIVKREQVEALREHVTKHVDAARMQNFGKLAAVSTDELRRWYQDEGLTCKAIGQRVGVGLSSVSQALRVRNIERRPSGVHWKGVSRSAETRRKMSEAKRGKASKLKGVPRSPETRQKISESHRRRVRLQHEEDVSAV